MTARFALGGLLLVATLALGTVEVQDTDAWTHLALGRGIVESRGFPANEPLSFPGAGMPYYNPEWLFDLVFYLAHAAAGIPGVIVLKAALVALAFLILLADSLLPRDPPGRRDLGVALAVATLFPFVVMLRHRFVERPDLVLMVFLGFTIYALNAFLWEGRRALYLLPLLQVVWVNMHPSIVVGLVPYVAVLAGGQIQRVVSARWGIELCGTPSAGQLRTVLRVFGLVLLASLLSPYGADPFLAPFRLAGSAWLRHEIIELQAPRWPEYAPPFVVVALLVVVFAATLRRLSVASVLLPIPFVYLGLSARRFVVLLAVVSAPILARQLRWIAGRLGPAWAPRLAVRTGLLVAAAIIIVSGLTLAQVEPFVDPDQVPGLGVNHEPLPEGALRYLDHAGVEGRVFNTFHWGGYIAWRDFPRRAAFVDGRGYVPPGLLDEMIAARGVASRLEGLRQRYGFDVAVLEYPRDWSPLRDETLDLDFGLTSPDWALVYWDDLALVYLRRTAALAATIERDEYRHVKPANGPLWLRPRLADADRRAAIESELRRNIAQTGSATARTLLGFVHNELGSHATAIEVLRGVAEFPPRPSLRTAYQGLANAHSRLGQARDAITYYRKAIRLGEDASLHYNLGLVLAKVGDDRQAIRHFDRALELDPRTAAVYPPLIAAHRRAGRPDRALKREAEYPNVLAYGQAEEHFRKGLKLYFEKRYEEAIAEFKTSVRVNPSSPHARSNLGWIYFDLGLVDHAFAAQRAALDVDPDFANAHYGLALIYRQRKDYAKARAHLEEYMRLEPVGYWSRRATDELNRLSDGHPGGEFPPPAGGSFPSGGGRGRTRTGSPVPPGS